MEPAIPPRVGVMAYTGNKQPARSAAFQRSILFSLGPHLATWTAMCCVSCRRCACNRAVPLKERGASRIPSGGGWNVRDM